MIIELRDMKIEIEEDPIPVLRRAQKKTFLAGSTDFNWQPWTKCKSSSGSVMYSRMNRVKHGDGTGSHPFKDPVLFCL